MLKTNTIHIVYSGNQKVLDGILISLISLTSHTPIQIHIHILTANFIEINREYVDITNEQCIFLEKYIQKTNINNRVTRHDMKSTFLECFKNKVIDPLRTPYTLLRLLLDRISLDCDKLIYLDADTIINKDISELWNVNIENYYAGVVQDCFAKKGYFNAGMMFMNISLMERERVFETCREILNEKCNYFFADQQILNKTITKKIMLPRKFNTMGKYFNEIAVHHFTNVRTWWWFHRIKPWETKLVVRKLPVYKNIIDTFLNIKQTAEYKKVNS